MENILKYIVHYKDQGEFLLAVSNLKVECVILNAVKMITVDKNGCLDEYRKNSITHDLIIISFKSKEELTLAKLALSNYTDTDNT